MSTIVFRLSNEYKDVSLVHDNLYSYNLSKTGHDRQDIKATSNVGQLTIVVEDEKGLFLGGISFHPMEEKDKLYVDYLFLSSALRGKGVGKKLFLEFEKYAKEQGVSEIHLTTNTFQAPAFYQSIGFEIVSTKESPTPLVPENIHYSLCKKLVDW